MNEQQAQRLLAKISEAIVETVNEAPHGAPCGPLYMALMHVWPSMTSSTFNMLIAALVEAGKVERRHDCLYRPATLIHSCCGVAINEPHSHDCPDIADMLNDEKPRYTGL